ncbi:small rab-related GTPase [Besnoitia besnoiti]|uniref:Small rab-related GTPase n=1 Tax=Besnoitia besnoiti TaxID=94643 RepID=A0A2A9M897_BESBE|nr:small rab-related GTPase [Besnoitia besnoiti]PFH33384.1 small rab-related GTPase [Besnoitia besnoiti]
MTMIEEDFDKTIKVIIVGNGTVGKSSLITRFADGTYTTGYKKTLAVDFIEKHRAIKMNDGSEETLTFLLWDTAGQEEYNSITRAYYRGAGAAVIVFSTTDRASFNAVKEWHRKIKEECGEAICVLVQNKIDLLDQAAVTPAEIEELRQQLNVRLFRTSVKENISIDDVFNYIGCAYLDPTQEEPEPVNDSAQDAPTKVTHLDAQKNCLQHHLKLRREDGASNARHVSRVERFFKRCVTD